MSWLISFMLAGMMVTSQVGFPTYSADKFVNPNVPQMVIIAPQVILLDETERFEQTYSLNANGRVGISNINGSITVESWDKNEVKLEAVKTADTKENLGNVKIKVDSKPEYLKVETEYDSWKNRTDGMWKNNKLEVQYRLWVPRNATLDQVETVNGSISVSNMANTTKISTVNGEVKAMNLRGTTSIETVNGTVNAEFDSLQNVSEISLEAVNGTTNLVIPSDSEATIKAETVNGSINNDFGLPVRKGQYVGRDLYGKIGSGAVKIKLEAVNGTLSIRRRQDGKNISPATNLLPAKSEDDESAVYVRDPKTPRAPRPPRNFSTVDSAKINAEVAKALKDSQKEMLNAQKEMQKAQKDLAQLPEISAITTEAISQSLSVVGTVMNGAMQAQINDAARRGLEVARQRRLFLRDANLPVVERKSESFNVKGTPKININAKSCKVFVRGWDKPEVQYSVVKLSQGKSQTPLRTESKQSDSTVDIEVSGISDDEEQIRVEVFVPKKSNLRILTNREIRVEGISGEVDLRGANEPINVRDVDGTLAVTSDNGAIRVIGFSGELTSKTIEGMMSLEGNFQKLSADAGIGTIVLTLPDGTDATLQSASEITAQGFNLTRDADRELWRIGKGGVNYNLVSSEGQIVIRNANQLKADY